MKYFLTCFFSEWWRPLLVAGMGFFVFALGGLTHSEFWEAVCSYVFGLTLLLLLISFVYQLVKKKKNAAFYTGLSFIGIFVALFFYGVFLMMVDSIAPEDRYADNLSIPKNIEVNEPKGEQLYPTQRPDSILNITRLKPDFELYHSFQPGLYEYDVWLGHIEKGTVYLKAYEVTRNDALSTGNLPERSTIEVYNASDSIKRFPLNHEFTIYEGDWGKPYAVRFEVWFQQANGGEERKLLQKNYKIEGWMR